MKVFKAVLNTIVNILIVLVLIVSILIATLAITSKNSGVSSIFGYSVQVVMSDSMVGGNKKYEGGDFKEGDVIIGKVTNNADADKPEEYKKGDIITYYGILPGNEDLGDQLLCHRIVDVKERDGRRVYQTQGDNKEMCPVPDQENLNAYIDSRSIVTKYHTEDYDGMKIAGFGNVLNYLNTKQGFFLCVLLPMIIFFIYVLIKVVIDIVNYKNAKNAEENEKNADPKTASMSDEEYEEFKAFMASKKAQNDSDNEKEPAPDAEEQSESESEESSDTAAEESAE